MANQRRDLLAGGQIPDFGDAIFAAGEHFVIGDVDAQHRLGVSFRHVEARHRRYPRRRIRHLTSEQRRSTATPTTTPAITAVVAVTDVRADHAFPHVVGDRVASAASGQSSEHVASTESGRRGRRRGIGRIHGPGLASDAALTTAGQTATASFVGRMNLGEILAAAGLAS